MSGKPDPTKEGNAQVINIHYYWLTIKMLRLKRLFIWLSVYLVILDSGIIHYISVVYKQINVSANKQKESDDYDFPFNNLL